MNVEVPVQIIWGLVGYVMLSTGGFIWWAAVITTKLDFGLAKLKDLSNSNSLYALKTDIARELGVVEKSLETMWNKFEKLKEKVDGGG